MKILIAGSVQGDGGCEEEALCALLARELTALGHQTDSFLLPYGRNMLTVPEQLLAYRLLEIYDCEMLITVGYPACILQFPNKVCYLLQTEPMLSEYWDSAYGVLANTQYDNIQKTVQNALRMSLGGETRVLCCSEILRNDLQKLGIAAKTLLYPALTFSEIEDRPEPEDSYWLCETSLLPWQRPEVVLELFSGLLEKDRSLSLRIFVPNADPIYRGYLAELIAAQDFSDRVQVLESSASKADYAGAAGVLCPDYESRRISNSAVTALELGKPLLAGSDCGALATYAPMVELKQTGSSGAAPVGGLTFAAETARSFAEKVVSA